MYYIYIYRCIYFIMLNLRAIKFIKIAQCSWWNCYMHVLHLHKLLMDMLNFLQQLLILIFKSKDSVLQCILNLCRLHRA